MSLLECGWSALCSLERQTDGYALHLIGWLVVACNFAYLLVCLSSPHYLLLAYCRFICGINQTIKQSIHRINQPDY
jgi:hypothetical protein